ncbi:plasmid partitioning protein RepB [Sinorhizobium alkalisoli]|uniref:Plasmid partitioning protein RepB n=1 Tax=Sinorhizobium alkalisoli TaxID=1752398 RepID=A0A1E3VHU3_9HYPH|nr:plasmid partitioning protein RepB [Sinorhizobium alkalisoli]MCG5478624.1 plasmid partitioning protein RepB [Sinorhizobium alkalisoli]ODR93169.1 plasmid partitioning protein RepB [Sinorhizobium alkalisoli]QFI70601.1 Plasmid replication protein RepB [Sinorhizobium alkalisoli]
MSKSPRKSIVASFGLLSAELENKLADDRQSAPTVSSSASRVGAGVIGAAHRAIDDIRSERDRLKALVESGGGAVRELDPSLIDPSPFPDRLPDDDGTDFEAFKRSIETEGQKVPVQVRQHPTSPGRYQIVYGHRRWLAAKQLGMPVRALEVEISDLDLVLAQGIENASRQDLTWIERALFASRMDDAGIKPRYIYAALSIEDAELARMRSVYRTVPADIIEAIGRAPKIGRPRWLDLAKAVAGDPSTLDSIRAALSMKGNGAETSDQRFQRVLNALKPAAKTGVDPTPISDGNGTKLAAFVMSPKEVRISAAGPLGTEFLKFVEAELPSLAERFARQREQ